MIGTGITPHIPVWDMSKREEGILSRADFAFDRQCDLYICPQGKFLRTTGTVLDGRTIVYRASTRDCGPCALKLKCTPNMTFRKIPRDVHEDARDATRALMGTPEFVKSRNERKKVEMRFAHLKTHHRFERMRLRGSPARATSSTSLPSSKTSRHSPAFSGARRHTYRPYRLCE